MDKIEKSFVKVKRDMKDLKNGMICLGVACLCLAAVNGLQYI